MILLNNNELSDLYDVLSKYIDRNFNLDSDNFLIYPVWYNFTLGNKKALFSTDFIDNFYWEVTYNKLKNEYYIDEYIKHDNLMIKGD